MIGVSAFWFYLSAAERYPCLHLIGDSTVADKPLDDNPERGWRQMLPMFFDHRIKVVNHARNGRSTKSFIREGLWQKVYDQLQPGNWLFIQFGHNDGKTADTSRYGAFSMARLVAEEIRRIDLPIAEFLCQPPKWSQEAVGKVVGLDYFYNREFKKNPAGEEIQFHYIWEDRENSGYSQLGDIFENLGAAIAEVHEAPTMETLARLSVYIIVDPDTIKENPLPNYLQPPTIDVIVAWVQQGGVLLLMGNDDGNAEFAHFNQLAGKFGIYFNKVSKHGVTGTNYEMGQFVNLPSHPIFAGVRKIFMKEISTLTIHEAAKPILFDESDVVIAEATVGKGYVCAVGDPWLYNEYIDHRRLPEDFDNRLAGENFARWLLSKAKKVR